MEQFCLEFRIKYAGQEPYKVWTLGVDAPNKLVAINRAKKAQAQLFDDAEKVAYLRCVTRAEYEALSDEDKAS